MGRSRDKSSARRRGAIAARREVLEDRAIRALIAVAGAGKLFQRALHGLKRRDLALQLRDMVLGQPLDVGAGARAVPPELQQPADILDREAEIARRTKRRVWTSRSS